MTVLTRDTIISYAGKKAGNENIGATILQDWLNNIIDQLGQAYKWPEFEKLATGTLSQHVEGQAAPSIAVPTDFGDLWDVHALSLIDSDGEHLTLQPQTQDFYDLLTDPVLIGRPLYAIFNLNAKTWTVFPVPERNYTWQLRYRIKPSRLTGNTIISFGNDEIFIQALYVQILQYEDDTRYLQALDILNKMIQLYLGGFNKSPIKSRNVRFNANVFKLPRNYR